MEPGGGRHPVDGGTAELLRDWDRSGGWELTVDGAPQSHVDLDDPTYLEFAYIRRMAAAIDLLAPAGQALRVLHLGGGALTLPRYVAPPGPARPSGWWRSTARWSSWCGASCRCRPGFHSGTGGRRARGRRGHRAARARPGDRDVFAGARTPAHLASVEFLREVARVLDPAGWLIANIADGPPLRHARAQVATIRRRSRRPAWWPTPRCCAAGASATSWCWPGRTPPPTAELTRRARARGLARPGREPTWTASPAAPPVTDAVAVSSPAPRPACSASPRRPLRAGPFRAENRLAAAR